MEKKQPIGNILTVIFCLGLATALLAANPGQAAAGEDLVAVTEPPEGWVSAEPPRTAEGNQLFTVINGGAELYVRLGFARAVFASYANNAGKGINLEIYQMKSPELAREVYTHKVGDKGRAADFGEAAFFEAYYLNFYKGPYQVTISGYDTDSQTVAGIFAIAGSVDRRLPAP
jgi:hypothetical protein